MKSITSMPSYQQAVHRHEVEPQYLSTAEVAARLRWSTRTLREKVRTGVFRRGVHFFEPAHTQRRWRWSSVAAWMEEAGACTIIDGERLRGLKEV